MHAILTYTHAHHAALLDLVITLLDSQPWHVVLVEFGVRFEELIKHAIIKMRVPLFHAPMLLLVHHLVVLHQNERNRVLPILLALLEQYDDSLQPSMLHVYLMHQDEQPQDQ